MVQISGKYEFKLNEPGMEEYLKALGIPDDRIKGLLADKPSIDFDVNGNNVKIVATGLNSSTQDFELNKPKKDTIFGFDATTVATLNGATLEITSTANDGSTFVRNYVFTEDGVTTTISDSKTGSAAVGKRTYKRVATSL